MPSSSLPLLPTTVVGSYPQPDWLIDRDRLAHAVPRVRSPDLWRVGPEQLAQAQDDATRLAIADMERAGIDIVTDGEMRRESYSNHFSNALEGFDIENPATITGRSGAPVKVPRIVSKVRRKGPVEVEATAFARALTGRRLKITVPGPFTMSRQAVNEFYKDEAEFALDLAGAVNEELKAIKAAGADVVQIDEPWLQTAPEAAAEYGLAAIKRALDGVPGVTVLHTCFGYAATVGDKKASGYGFLGPLAGCAAQQISVEAAQPRLDPGFLSDLAGKTVVYGVLDLGAKEAETPAIVADRIRAALPFAPAENLVPAPDCGMKYLPRARAFAKLKALCDGAAIVRRELAG